MLASMPARAASGPTEHVRLSWSRLDGAGACPDSRWARDNVRRRLDRDPFAEQGRRSLEVVLAREGSEWVARLLVWGPGGARLGLRRLVSREPRCQAVAEAAALAVALTIDPRAALVIRERQTPAPRQVAPARRPPVRAIACPTCAPQLPPRLIRADSGVALALKLLPRAAPGWSFDVAGTLYRSLDWQIGAAFLPEVAGTADEAFGFALALGNVGLAWSAYRGKRMDLSLYTRLHVGGILPVVRRHTPVDPRHRLWLAPGLGLRGELAVWGPLIVAARAELLAPVLRDRFAVEGLPGVGYRTPPLGALLSFSLGLRNRRRVQGAAHNIR